MLILIASETDIKDEIQTLHQLFDAGLNYYHLRKPNKSETAYARFLSQIDKQYHQHIVLHQHHNLTNDFRVKGIYLQEQPRVNLQDTLQKYVDDFKNNGFTVSSSFHHPDTIKKCRVAFDYHLLSPVFSSISKKGYEGKGFSVNGIDKTIIGMGGVTADNLSEIKQKGFKGAGILGGVWNQENPLEAFQKLMLNSDF